MLSSSIVFSFSILALFAWAQAILPSHKPPVLDSDGNAVQSGVDYHVISAHSGGLSLGSRDEGFPFSVVQHASDERSGKRIRFSPASSSSMDGIIRQSVLRTWVEEMNSSGTQRMGEADEAGRRYVTLGGKAGHPGRSTLNNWFKIEGAGVHNHHRAYIFAHCPDVCESCKTTCSGLGISSQYGRRWVSASSHPLRVMFMRADDLMAVSAGTAVENSNNDV